MNGPLHPSSGEMFPFIDILSRFTVFEDRDSLLSLIADERTP